MTTLDTTADQPKPRRTTGLGSVAWLLLGLFKLGKAGGTLVTMLVSIGVYSLAFGWRFATGFILLLLVHEMGHYLAAVQRGLNVSMPTFIPFVGAAINLREQPVDVETEAYVASAGPLLGSLGALAVYLVAIDTGSQLLMALAYSGFILNFFNLIPISPLDGGRITAIVSPRIWFLGAPMMVALMLYRPSPLLVLLAIISVPALIQAWRHDPDDPETRRYYAASTATKLGYGAFYLGLAAALAILAHQAHEAVGTV